jgi:hypothetical protein
VFGAVVTVITLALSTLIECRSPWSSDVVNAS